MSHSYKKHPFTGTCVCRSEKSWKRLANRKLRKLNHMRLLKMENFLAVLLREVSNVWTFGKDGKARLTLPQDIEFMRK